MRVHFYSAVEADDGKHLGDWSTDPENGVFPQVPRIGDTVWLETDEAELTKFVVKDVHWEFKNRRVLGTRVPPRVGAEVYVSLFDIHSREGK